MTGGSYSRDFRAVHMSTLAFGIFSIQSRVRATAIYFRAARATLITLTRGDPRRKVYSLQSTGATRATASIQSRRAQRSLGTFFMGHEVLYGLCTAARGTLYV